MRVLLSGLFILFLATLQGQTISGTAHSSYIGKPAYLFAYSDAISKYRVLLDSCTVKPDSTFNFTFKTDKIVEGVISIDRVNATLFLEPNSRFKVYFAELPANQIKTINNSNIINLEFQSLSKTDLNALIASFNTEFDVFFDSQVANIFDRTFPKTLQNFHHYCDSTYSVFKNPFLNQYIQFCFANFELNSGAYRKVLFEKYLTSQKFDIHNPEFGNFVTAFFETERERFDRFSKSKPLATAMAKGNCTDFLEQIKNNDFLKTNEQLREIAVLCIFREEYRKKGSPKTALIKMIDDLARLSTHPTSKSLAQHIKAELTRFEIGYPAYAFKLKSIDNKVVKLENFLGKPTLIMATSGLSKSGNLEMNLLKGLYQKYGKKINFLIIDMDDDPIEFARLASTSGNPLTVNYASDKYLIEQLNINAVPKFILLDKAGNYLNPSAPAPSKGLENELQQLVLN